MRSSINFGSRTLTVLLPIQLLITLAPGPHTSMTAPKLENEAFASAMVEAATVIADGALAGEVFWALTFELPAATYQTGYT